MSFSRLNYSEPAVLRGIITAVLSLAAAVGFVIPANLTATAEALIPVASFLVPIALSLWTRAAVSSPRTVARIRAAGPQTPGVADHAAPEV